MYRFINYWGLTLGLFFAMICTSNGQENVELLSQESFDSIYNGYFDQEETEDKGLFAKAYLKKAKRENELNLIIRGYRFISVTYKEDERTLHYSDSIIQLTKDDSNKYYPAIAYERKGDYYHNKNAFSKALENYLLFYEFSKKHDYELQMMRAQYNIATLKRRIGKLQESIDISRALYAYTKEHKEELTQDNFYLNSISSLAALFYETSQLDSAYYYSDLGMQESLLRKDDYYYHHFATDKGITLFFQEKYQAAIDTIAKHATFLEKVEKYDDLAFAYFYSGEAHLQLNQKDAAIENYMKVDSIFQAYDYIFPNLRKTYIRLDSLYREKGASLKVIENLTKRIKVDSMLNASNLYIYDGLAQKYDIPKLEAEKEDLIAAMERKERLSNYTYIILAFLIALTFFGFVFEFRKRKMYKRKFDEIIKASENKKEAFTHPETKHSQKINIAEDIVENVLSALKTFEEKHQYTSNKITLNSLAKKLNTNPNYLSKIVNHYKGCSFSNYINGMRIDFCIEQLKNNPTFIKYTIKAISAEIGFNNVQSFSKAFYNSKGVYPSFFIKEMKKSKQKNATNS